MKFGSSADGPGRRWPGKDGFLLYAFYRALQMTRSCHRFTHGSSPIIKRTRQPGAAIGVLKPRYAFADKKLTREPGTDQGGFRTEFCC
jgi:hypothetical protein